VTALTNALLTRSEPEDKGPGNWAGPIRLALKAIFVAILTGKSRLLRTSRLISIARYKAATDIGSRTNHTTGPPDTTNCVKNDLEPPADDCPEGSVLANTDDVKNKLKKRITKRKTPLLRKSPSKYFRLLFIILTLTPSIC
jgi:hypothetical protein